MAAESQQSAQRTVTILGVYQYSPAYPNAKFVIDLIRSSDAIAGYEINMPMFKDLPMAGRTRSTFRKTQRIVSTALRTIYSHFNVLLRFTFSKKSDVVYVPYPAIGVLVMFSLLPRFLRPRRILADAFISIYDTAVADRELIKRSGLLARFLKALERRAYTTATLTTVDTDESRDYYAELFDLPRSKFVPVPLATDEDNFCDAAYSATSDVCNVLFVGTFVPLQGTDVIARAIVELKDSSDISFTIVGSGQCAAAFADILDNPLPNNMTWIQEWQDSASVAAHIRAADICLGVFSDGLKAERVWPFKNYAYMACGRALVTADTTTARRMLANDDSHPFVTIPAGDALALAAKIVELADAPEFRSQLARKSRRYYDRHLSNTIVRDQLIGKLFSA